MESNSVSKKLENAVVSYLRGVRNELQFFEQLTKSVAEGGLGLSPEKATKVKAQIDAFRDRILSQGKTLEQVVNEYLGKNQEQGTKSQASDVSGPTSAKATAGEQSSVVEDVEIDVKSSHKEEPYRPPFKIEPKSQKSAGELLAANEPFYKHVAGHQETLSHLKEIGASAQKLQLETANLQPEKILAIPSASIPNLPTETSKPPVSYIINPEAKKKESMITIRVPAGGGEVGPPVQYKINPEQKKVEPMISVKVPAQQVIKKEVERVEEKKTPVSNDINDVQKRPVVQRVEKKVVPPQISNLIAQEAANAQIPNSNLQSPTSNSQVKPVMSTPPTQVISTPIPEKKGFFARLFGSKKKKDTPAKPVMEKLLNQEYTMIPTSGGSEMQLPKQTVQNYQRPKVEDVAYTPKLFTPVDELSSLSLQDFRRLAKDPVSAAQKILDKIDLLAQESMQKRGQGVAALKSSALYNAYSKIMNQSMMEGRPFAQVVSGQDNITMPEFEAIMDLNRRLKV